MNDALLVRLGQRMQGVAREAKRVEPIEPPDPPQPVSDRLALEHLHGQEPGAIFGLAEIEGGHGVRANQRADRARLAFEAALCLWIVRPILAHELQRNVAPHPFLTRAIDRAHRATAQATEYRKAPGDGRTE